MPGSGQFSINGQLCTPQISLSPSQMRKLKVQHVPEDRQKLGLVKNFSAAESSVLGYQREEQFNSRVFLLLGAIRKVCQRLMDTLDVRPADPALRSATFSGGNQQKLILARELDKAPEVLLIGQPTRGVDIGAIELIHEQIVTMRDAGCAILLVSVELDEIMALSDRIIVMYEGQISGELDASQADKTQIGLMMANVHGKSPASASSAGAA